VNPLMTSRKPCGCEMKLDTRAFEHFENQIVALDAHAGGEPMRMLIGGLPEIPGVSINDKRLYLQENLDQIRLLTTQEPRGHRDMFAGIIVKPVTPGADFGLIFMDARRYPYMCGHGTICAVTAFLEMGWLEAQGNETHVVVDTPSGPVHALARVSHADDSSLRVESVAIQLESAFAESLDQSLEVPGLGRIAVDIAFAGGYFILLDAGQIGIELLPENSGKLASLGMRIMQAGNRQFHVQHPTREYIRSIDVVEFFDPRGHEQLRGLNFVVFGEGHVDRSPCGTGTSAKMALLHARGKLQPGQTFTNQGLLGTTFEGCIVALSQVGDRQAIVPEIRASAYLTGLQRFILRPDDPFPYGFLVPM
jgi:proline racemase